MKKLNQKGFSAIEVVLGVVIIGIIVMVGWYVASAGNDPVAAPDQKTVPAAEADETAGWKTYSRYGISFKYPGDWTLYPQDDSQSSATYIQSPDYASTPGETAIDGTTVGASIAVDMADYVGENLTADNFKEAFLDKNPNEHENYEQLIINDRKAVQFHFSEAFSKRTTVFFLENDRQVSFDIDVWSEGSDALNTYQKIVRTVTY